MQFPQVLQNLRFHEVVYTDGAFPYRDIFDFPPFFIVRMENHPLKAVRF